jgi:hypothetical protein
LFGITGGMSTELIDNLPVVMIMKPPGAGHLPA